MVRFTPAGPTGAQNLQARPLRGTLCIPTSGEEGLIEGCHARTGAFVLQRPKTGDEGVDAGHGERTPHSEDTFTI